MSLEPWPELRAETLARYKVFEVRRAVRRSPRNGHEIGFFLVSTADWVNVVALTAADELILVRQYRHGSQRFTLEIPGGIVHADEPSLEAARRELREETGFVAAQLVPLGHANPNPALFTNRCHTFLATGCTPAGALLQDDGEDIEVVVVPWVEAEQMAARGEIDHALALAGMYFHRLGRGGPDGA